MTSDDTISRETIDNVLAFISALLSRVDELDHRFEVTANIGKQELTVLTLLADNGTMRVKDIVAQLVGVSPSTLTRILDRLESDKLVKRTLNPQDRRSFRITLAEWGAEIVENYNEELELIARQMLLPLTPAERMMLAEWQSDMATALLSPERPIAALISTTKKNTTSVS